jgi:uncharacterized damage-inducible protein DinB
MSGFGIACLTEHLALELAQDSQPCHVSTPEEFTRSVAGGYGSIRNTMVHVLSAEWGWLTRCCGLERVGRPNPGDYPTVESLIETWNKVEIGVRDFLSKLKNEDLPRNVEYMSDEAEGPSMPLGELMQHAANHGVHHRGRGVRAW